MYLKRYRHAKTSHKVETIEKCGKHQIDIKRIINKNHTEIEATSLIKSGFCFWADDNFEV